MIWDFPCYFEIPVLFRNEQYDEVRFDTTLMIIVLREFFSNSSHLVSFLILFEISLIEHLFKNIFFHWFLFNIFK